MGILATFLVSPLISFLELKGFRAIFNSLAKQVIFFIPYQGHLKRKNLDIYCIAPYNLVVLLSLNTWRFSDVYAYTIAYKKKTEL